MSSLNNPTLHLKGGVWTEQEKHLTQTKDELFDLAGQIVVLAQTTPCSREEERTLTALQEREEHLMSKAEKLQKRIA